MKDGYISLEDLIRSLPEDVQMKISARAEALISTYAEVIALQEKVDALERENAELKEKLNAAGN